MTSRFVSSEQWMATSVTPRWLPPAAFGLLIVCGAAVVLARLAHSPSPVEAPGFLTPSQGEMQIAAYVPPSHPEYATHGARATVIFPDGERRSAAIADPADESASLRQRELIGDSALGTLVRVQLIDERPLSAADLVEGLPVKLRFDSLRFDSASAK